MTVQHKRKLSCADCGAPLADQIEGETVKCAHCGRGHPSIVPPPPSDITRHSGRGDAVAVKWGERWWPARIVECFGENRYLVHYDGWGPTFDEEVEPERIRPLSVPHYPVDPNTGEFRRISPPRRIFGPKGIFLVIFVLLILGTYIATKSYEHESNVEIKPDMMTSLSWIFSIPSVPSDSRPVIQDEHLLPNQRVFVRKDDTWYSGFVVFCNPDGTVKIRYGDPENGQIEIVRRRRLRLEK